MCCWGVEINPVLLNRTEPELLVASGLEGGVVGEGGSGDRP